MRGSFTGYFNAFFLARAITSTDSLQLTCAICTAAPAFSASSISRLTLLYSDSLDTPFKPSRVEVKPKFTTPELESFLSSQ